MRAITAASVLAGACVAALLSTPALAADDAWQAQARPSQATPPPPPPGSGRATPARQTPPPPPPAGRQWRGFIAAGAMFQPEKASFTDARSRSVFRETATWSGDYDVDGGIGADIGAVARLWGNLGAGLAVTSVTRAGTAALSASYPHPFFFGRTRPADADADDVDRTETGVHVSLAYLVPASGRLRLTLFGGPSLYAIEQTVVDDLTVNEAYPYDSITIAPAGTTDVSETAVGFHAGADATWYVTERLGAGVLLRYATATKSVSVNGGDDFDLKAGGLQVGVGLRLRF
jgi:opacity protein-like surface antigen